jgi:hypothetical protein
MVDEKLIDKAILSFDLGYNANDFEQESYMIFGGVNHSAYEDSLINFPLKLNHWWALDIKEFSYDGESMKVFQDSDNAIAIVDTGTSLASVPADVHATLVEKWTAALGM